MDQDLTWTEIAEKISQATGRKIKIIDRQTVSGGCINQAYLISTDRLDHYFIKLNQPSLAEMFAAEAKGLLEIAATDTITVPVPICWGVISNHSYLVLEYLDLTNHSNPKNWTQLGQNLAAMHRYQITNTPKFGWQIDNTIGSTPQINTWETDWTTFFKNQRIGYQLQLARRNGGNFPKGNELLAAIPQLLANHHPQPSLVHGDLWGGNAGFTTAGIPIIFDPATYWGDREVDLAMTELFGGFPAAFYQGYTDVYPPDAGYPDRKILYNLYHILNHYNLFGGSYQSQANGMIDSLLEKGYANDYCVNVSLFGHINHNPQ
jgi:fructosamine-3-kinase